MKKRFLSIFFAFILIFSLFASCKKPDNPKMHTVTVYSLNAVYKFSLFDKVIDGFRILEQFEIEDGKVIGTLDLGDYKTTTYRFCGWYTDKYYTEQWNTHKDEVHCDLTLYAKWEKIT